MMTLTSLLAESVVLSVMVRAVLLVTLLLACAWVLARQAGPRKAALWSHIWTTAVTLVLLIPLFSMLCEHQEWTLVDLPANENIQYQPAGMETRRADGAPGDLAFQVSEDPGSDRLEGSRPAVPGK